MADLLRKTSKYAIEATAQISQWLEKVSGPAMSDAWHRPIEEVEDKIDETFMPAFDALRLIASRKLEFVSEESSTTWRDLCLKYVEIATKAVAKAEGRTL